MNNKRLLIVANDSGGLYRFRKMLMEKLISDGNSVIAMTPFDTDVEELKKIGLSIIESQIDRRGINPLKDIKLCLSYFRKLKKIKPDLVITYTIKPNIYCGFAARVLKIPYVVNITGLGTTFQNENILKKIVISLYKIGLKKAKLVFFENEVNMSIFVENKIISRDKACLLNGAGVDLNHFRYLEYPKEQNKTNFLFIGRVMREKGVDELFEAMRLLVEQGYNVKLEILGAFEEDYKEKIEKYRAEGWLEYKGLVRDVRPFIEKAHCFVLPSWHEGMANTNLECASSGRPVITTRIPGCQESVIDGKSGYLVIPKNSQDLYKKMKLFLNLSIETKREMGKSGRQHMEKVFDKRKVVENTIYAINNMMNHC